MNSILQNERKCFICGKQGQLDCHHCLSGISNRKHSERLGLKIWLCPDCHRKLHDDHHGRELELSIKQLGQRKFEEVYGTRQEFISIFGKSYL